MIRVLFVPAGRTLCAMMLFVSVFVFSSSSNYLLAYPMLSPVRIKSLPASSLATLPTTTKALPVFRDNTASYQSSQPSSPPSSQNLFSSSSSSPYPYLQPASPSSRSPYSNPSLLNSNSPTNPNPQSTQTASMSHDPSSSSSKPTTTTMTSTTEPVIQQQPILQPTPQIQPQQSQSQQSVQLPVTQPVVPQSQVQPSIQGAPAQPFVSPSDTNSLLQQQSQGYLPPSANTFPPSIAPPVSSYQSPYQSNYPYGGNAYPYPYSNTGNVLGSQVGSPTLVSSSNSQIVSPWFPSLPAISCGGTFTLTIEGVPESNKGQNGQGTPSNVNSGVGGGGGKSHGSNKNLLALQVLSDNTRLFTDNNAISGQIFKGKNNIDRNNGNNFDIKTIFNDCQVVTYSNL
jgi:hypothetical protein